jgi:hypothetical protein
LSGGKLRASILDGLAAGALFDVVCERNGVTLAQVRYRREYDAAFNAAMSEALEAGKAIRLMPLERRVLFLNSCKWLGHIDTAREAIGLSKEELATVFKHNPKIRRAAIEAFQAGRKVRDHNGALYRYADFGRKELRKLGHRALAMEELGEIPE